MLNRTGLRDRNSARLNITETYVRQCHQVFVVTRIGRAITDMSVKGVFELARRANLRNVGIICTQSDVRPSFPNSSIGTENTIGYSGIRGTGSLAW
jgi:hypothetical protein